MNSPLKAVSAYGSHGRRMFSRFHVYEQGPSQAIYGGIYFGRDRVIANEYVSDYIDLAWRLIEAKEMYQKWSEHALKQYERHANAKEYVGEFEKIIKNSL